MNRRVGLIVLFLICALGIASCSPGHGKGDEGGTETASKPAESKDEHEAGGVNVSRSENGNAVISIDEKTQQHIGLKLQKMEKSTRQRILPAFGRLEQDPVATFTVRAPLAGFIVSDSYRPWPSLGQSINAGTLVGHVRPRLSPVEMFDMRTRLATAHAEVEEVLADLDTARKSLASKQLLNVDQKVVSERTLEEAERDVKKGETRLAAARETVKLLEDAVNNGGGISVDLPLKVDRMGQVVLIDAEPGEAVESGQIILKVADQSKLIARIDLATCPPSEVLSVPLGATIEIGGTDKTRFQGKYAGSSTPADLITSGRSFLFSISDPEHRLSPGLPVVAYMQMPGTPLEGFVVPDESVLRYAGGAWVYVRTAEDKFERLPLENPIPSEKGLFVQSLPGSEVIVEGAGLLLSEELKSQIEAEEEGSE